MADQNQWFKLWCSADEDPDLGNLSNEDFGRWCKLGMYVKKHGKNGQIMIPTPAAILQGKFHVSSYAEVTEVLQRFPNIDIEPDVKCDGKKSSLRLSFRNWHKYQIDTSAARMRNKRLRDGLRGEEKRGDEKREEIPSPQPPSSEGGEQPKGRKTRKRKPPAQEAHQYQETWNEEPWPSVRKFVALYNERSPAEWPKAEILTDTRTDKIREYLKQFPKQEFWEKVYDEAGKSNLCRTYRGAGMDWLLKKGQDGFETCVKIYEVKFDR